MARIPDPFSLRRIVVAMDSSHRPDPTLEAAALLAEALGSELSGLFVEDSDLINAAGLPFAKITSPFGGLAQDVSGESVASEMKALADAAQLRLRKLSETRRLRWSFETRRGRIDREIRATVQSTDIVCLCGPDRLADPSAQVSELVETAAATLLGSPRHDLSRGDVVVLIDDLEFGEPAVEIAARLAAKAWRKLTIILVGPAAEKSVELRSRIDALRREEIAIDIASCADCDPYRMLDAIGRTATGFFVSGMRTISSPGWARACGAAFRCPVLILKAGT